MVENAQRGPGSNEECPLILYKVSLSILLELPW